MILHIGKTELVISAHSSELTDIILLWRLTFGRSFWTCYSYNEAIVSGTYYTAMIGNHVDFQGRVVVEVGAGTGVLSLFAAQVLKTLWLNILVKKTVNLKQFRVLVQLFHMFETSASLQQTYT